MCTCLSINSRCKDYRYFRENIYILRACECISFSPAMLKKSHASEITQKNKETRFVMQTHIAFFCVRVKTT